MKHKNRVAAVAVAASMAVVAAGCGNSDGGSSDSSSSNVYKFAVVSDLSGALGPTFGAPIAMLQAYIKDLNARGGVNGRKVEIELKDSQASAPNAVTFTKEVAGDDGTLALLGLGLSNEMDAILPLLERYKLTGISAPSSANQIEVPSGPVNDYYWSAGIDYVNFAGPSVDFMDSKGPGLKVGVIGYDSALTHSATDQLSDTLEESGGSVVAAEYLPLTTVDAAPSLQKVLDADPDWIVNMSMPAAMNQSFVSALQLRAPTTPVLYLANGCATSIMARADRENYYAVCSAVPPVSSLSDSATKMRSVATDNGFGSAVASDAGDDSFATYGWVLGRTIEETLKKCGDDCDRAAFHETLSSLTLDSDQLSGAVDYSAENRFAIRQAMVLTWNTADQTPEVVEPFFDVY